VTNAIDLAITLTSLDALSAPALDALRRSAKEGLEQTASDIPGVKITTKVIEGFLLSSLVLDEAKQSGSDLIVLGTSSKHGLTKLVLGSTAEEIIRNASCPVLTVGPHVAKPADGSLRFRRIVYATDFSSQASRAAQYALLLAHDSEAKLYLCHVIPDSETTTATNLEATLICSLKEIVPESEHDKCVVECVVAHGNAATGILALAARVNADLIVLGARKSSFWLTYVNTGVTPALLAEANCPILTVC
jgi:nucleotide-binding universal stress UspA family protein